MQAAAQGLFQYLTQFLQALDILTIKYKAVNAVDNSTKRCELFARGMAAGFEKQGIVALWLCAIFHSYVRPNGSYDRIVLNSTRVKLLNDDVDLKFVLEVSFFYSKLLTSEPMTAVWFCG